MKLLRKSNRIIFGFILLFFCTPYSLLAEPIDIPLISEEPHFFFELSSNIISPLTGSLFFNIENSDNTIMWEAKTNDSWLSVNANTHKITVDYEMNKGEARIGNIIITDSNQFNYHVQIIQPSFKIICESKKVAFQANWHSYLYKDGTHYFIWTERVFPTNYNKKNIGSSIENYDYNIWLSSSNDGINWESKKIIPVECCPYALKLAIDKNGNYHILYREMNYSPSSSYQYNLIHATNINNQWEKTSLFSELNSYSYVYTNYYRFFLGKDNKLHFLASFISSKK